MKRLTIFVCAIALFPISSAWAGFEWVPPAYNPMPTSPSVPMPSYQPYGGVLMPAPVAPPMVPSAPNAFPSSPVMSEPLPPTSMVPPAYNVLPPMAAPTPVPSRNLSKTGLVIDPYPLRGSGQATTGLTNNSVQQAMAEEAKILHPLHLGAGMTTGAQPKKMPSASVGGRGYERKPQGPISGRMGMTPMMGGEPAPLSNIENAYRQPTPPAQNYAQAVGFGRDLPLGLALSQIIPSEYSYSFVESVDAGITVSWKGGKPWNQVLQDMLRPKNLTASIEGNRVIIRPSARL